MEEKILYILLILVTFCSTAHIRNVNFSNNTTVGDDTGDCTVENITYSNGEKVPSPGPCEECHCRSSEVICSMIKCKPNTSGCKVIQQANHCCPQYKCETHHSGGNNGNNNNYTNISGKREMQPWLLTVSVNNQTSPSSVNMETPTPNKYPQTIKIIEILPTQISQVQKVTGPILSHVGEDHVQLLSAEGPSDSHDQLVSTTQFHSPYSSSSSTEIEDKEESEKNEDILSSTFSPSTSDISKSDENSYEENIKENITDLIQESSTIINDVDSESITLINDDGISKIDQGHLATIISEVNEGEELQQSTQSEFDNKEDEIDKVTLHSLENKEQNNDNESFERSAMLNDQRSDSSEEVFTTNTNYGRLTMNENTSEDLSLDNATLEEVSKEMIPTSEESVTSESGINSEHDILIDEDHVYSSKNSVYDKISPTENAELLTSEYWEKISVPHQSQRNTNNLNFVSSPFTVYHDLSTINDESLSHDSQPDSESYTTILPQKFDANIIEFNTENNDFDPTEGSGFDLINGWTYADPTSEDYNEFTHTNRPETSEINLSPNVQLNEMTTSTESVSVSEDNLLITPESSSIIPDVLDHSKHEYQQDEALKASTSSDENSSSDDSSSTIDENQQKTKIAFPSILKLNDQIQFLKIQGQEQDEDENKPIARIGIYNPKKPNDMANLVTVVKETNAQLEGQINNEKVMAKHEESYTPHILLTPNDLKTLAELLIHEKIIPSFYQNVERTTNDIDQRSINQEITSSSETQNVESNVMINSTVSSEEESNTSGNYSNENDLVEIINVDKLTSKGYELLNEETTTHKILSNSTDAEIPEKLSLNSTDVTENFEETTTHKISVNLTDKEKWAQNVLNHIVSNILVPLTGIEIIDADNDTSSENSTSTSTEENITETNDNDTTERDFTTTTEINHEHSDEIAEYILDSAYVNEYLNNKDENDSKSDNIKSTTNEQSSRKSRVPSKSLTQDDDESLLTTSMLADQDIMLLHDFFKKTLNTK